jgi:hypothetical protein
VADQEVLRCLTWITFTNLTVSTNMQNLKNKKSEESVVCVMIYGHVVSRRTNEKEKKPFSAYAEPQRRLKLCECINITTMCEIYCYLRSILELHPTKNSECLLFSVVLKILRVIRCGSRDSIYSHNDLAWHTAICCQVNGRAIS